MDLTALIKMSRKYGADENCVLAGGGNTSYKKDGIMAVKASGSALGTITEAGFVLMDVEQLRALPQKNYPEDDQEREKLATAAMMAARLPYQADKRPSVECILHALFDFNYVLHLHPALVNGMTCGLEGKNCCAAIFAEEALWLPLIKPGLVLSQVCALEFETYKKRNQKAVSLVFLQNHGLIVAANTINELAAKMTYVFEELNKRVIRYPDLRELKVENKLALTPTYGAFSTFSCEREILNYAVNNNTMKPLLRPFTPDHIVYCKPAPLYIEETEELDKEYKKYTRDRGYEPKVVVVKDLGIFALGDSHRTAENAHLVFVDALKIAVYSESFGGPLVLPDDFTDFILNWELESYRAKKFADQG